MMDFKVCPVCLSYQGRIFTDAEIVSEFPFSEYGHPNVHPNCRCWFKPQYVDEKRAQEHFDLTEESWEPLPERAKYVLLVAFLALLQEDEFKRCVRNRMDKGMTKEEAEKKCREREEGYPPTTALDEIDRSKQLLEDHKARYRPLIR